MTAGFRTIANLVGAAPLSEETRGTISWCLGQLPGLYKQFGENHDIFYSDKIAHLEKGVLKELGKAKDCPDTQKLTAKVLANLKALHEEHGLQSLDPKLPKPKKVKGK